MKAEDFNALAKCYLESNACGMWDGSLKADMHRSLCELFIARRLDIKISKAAHLELDGENLAGLVRASTTSLTDNLDSEIGFPLETAPNYKKLTPIFVEKFLELATDWFDEQTALMSDDELREVSERVTRNKFSHIFHALSSYGFEFVDGDSEKDRFLTMKSKLGQIVTVKPNAYFGCHFNLDAALNEVEPR